MASESSTSPTTKESASHADIAQDKRDIRRGSTANIFGFLARLCARVPFLVIAGQLYGKATYGEYVPLTAIVETTALLSTFGLKRTIFRFMEEWDTHGREVVIRHALILALGFSFALLLVLHIFAPAILSYFRFQSR